MSIQLTDREVTMMPPPLPAPPGVPPSPPSPPILRPVQPVLVPLESLPHALTCQLKYSGWARIEGVKLLSPAGAPIKQIEPISVADAFGTSLPDDRYLLMYALEEVDQLTQTWRQASYGMRMNGAGLALMEAIRKNPGQFGEALSAMCQNTRVRGNVLAVDYDLPGHGEWTPDLIEQVQQKLLEAGINSPIIAAPSVAYKTKGGFRLVWFLSESIPIEGPRGLKDLLPGLVVSMHIAGIHVDTACKDWTRLFRLPRVMRQGKDGTSPTITADQPYMAQSWGRIDFTKNECLPADGLVLVYPPEAFKAGSEFKITDVMFRLLPELLAKLKHIGKVPPESNQTSTVSAGNRPAQDFTVQVQAGTGANEYTHKAQIRKWVGAAAKVTKTNMLPSASATTAQLHLFGNALMVDPSNPGETGLHQCITQVTMAVMRTLRKELAAGSAHLPTIYVLLLQNALKSNELRKENRRSDEVLAAEVWSVVTWAFQQEMSTCEDEQDQEQAEQEREQEAAQVQVHTILAQETLILQALGRMIEKDPRLPPGFPPSPDQCNWLKAATKTGSRWKKMLILDVPGRGNAVLTLRADGHFVYGNPLESFKRLIVSVRECNHDHITTMEKKADKDTGKELTRLEIDIMRDYATLVTHHRMSRMIQGHQVSIRFDLGEPVVTFVESLPGLKQSIQPRYDPDVDEWLRALGGADHEDLFNWLAAFWDLSRPSTMLHIKGDSDCGKSLLIKGLQACTESNVSAPVSDMFGDFQDLALRTPLLIADEENASNSKTARSVINVLKKLATGEANTINAKGKAAVQIEGYWRVIMVENGRRMLQFQEDMTKVDRAALLKRLLCIEADSAACRVVIDRMGGRGGLDEWVRYKIPEHIRWISKNRELSKTDRVLAMSLKQQDGLNIGTNTMNKVISAIGEMLEDRLKYAGQYWIKDDLFVVKPKILCAVMQQMAKDRGTQMPSPQSFHEAMRTLAGDEGKAYPIKLKANQVVRGHAIHWQEITPRIQALGEHLDIREAMGEVLWLKWATVEMRADFDGGNEMPAQKRGPVQDGVVASRSLGETMRAAAAMTNGHANGNGHHALPSPPSIMAMGPSALFSASSLPLGPLPPSQN